MHGESHSGRIAQTVEKCREEAPKKVNKELVKHFNQIINQVSEINSTVRDAIRDYLFLGEVNPDGKVDDEYCELVLNLAAGLPNDETQLYSDGRENNSLG